MRFLNFARWKPEREKDAFRQQKKIIYHNKTRLRHVLKVVELAVVRKEYQRNKMAA